MKNERIWELDALRGLCILGMILIHFVFDLVFFDGFELTLPPWFQYLQQYGHLFFILISGICATLGSKSFRRGLIVFGADSFILPSLVLTVLVLLALKKPLEKAAERSGGM